MHEKIEITLLPNRQMGQFWQVYLIVTQPVQQVQMSPKLLINDYFDIIEYHKGDKIQQYDTISMYTVYVEPLQRIMVNHDFQEIL